MVSLSLLSRLRTRFGRWCCWSHDRATVTRRLWHRSGGRACRDCESSPQHRYFRRSAMLIGWGRQIRLYGASLRSQCTTATPPPPRRLRATRQPPRPTDEAAVAFAAALSSRHRPPRRRQARRSQAIERERVPSRQYFPLAVARLPDRSLPRTFGSTVLGVECDGIMEIFLEHPAHMRMMQTPAGLLALA